MVTKVGLLWLNTDGFIRRRRDIKVFDTHGSLLIVIT